MIFWLSQIFSIIGMGFNISSFQCKTKRNMMLVLAVGCCMFFLNFLLLGAYDCAFYNVLSLIRSVLIVKKNKYYNLSFTVLCIGYSIISLLTYQSPWTLVLLAAQIFQTFAMWYKSENFIRKAQLFGSSPFWLVNNIFFAFSIGGIVCEVFTIISTIIALFRFRKSKVIQ